MTTEGEVNGSTKVTFTVKELFAELLAKMGTIEGKLDTKASSAEVTALKDEQVKLTTRVLVLETERKDTRSFNTFWIPVIISIVETGAIVYAGWPHK